MERHVLNEMTLNEDETNELELFNYDNEDGEDTVDHFSHVTSHETPSIGYASEWRQLSSEKRYRHFSTSICSFFGHPTDFLSLLFCGIFQSDRTYFLLHGRRPPKSSLVHRFVIYLLGPFALLILGATITTLYTTKKDHEEDNQLPLPNTPLLLLPLSLYLLFLARKIQSWRADIRASILTRAIRYDQLNNSQGTDDNMMERSNFSDSTLIRKNKPYFYCAHQLCCGCYPRDDFHTSSTSTLNNDSTLSPSSFHINYSSDYVRDDFFTKILKFFSSICCGSICSCWCQCCGICALAQEAREVNRIISKKDQMIDLITFEPYSNYFHKIHYLRTTFNQKFTHHCSALSLYSVRLSRGFGIYLIFALIHAYTYRNIEHWFMIIATFFQSFFLLYIIYWKKHKFLISLDAVIKFYAAGFIFSISMSLVTEYIVSFVVKIITFLVVSFSENTVGSLINDFKQTKRETEENAEELSQSLAAWDWTRDYVLIVILQNFFSSFVTAAVVEEACKYFSFFIIEHPDFLPLSDVLTSTYSNNNNENIDGLELNEIETNNTINRVTDRSSTNENQIDHDRVTMIPDNCSYLSQGTKVTLAMVSVAIGFACNENISYVFLNSGGKLGNELSVLLQRSVLPIHPMCAALQSVGVCRRELEKDNSFTVGRILKPAILLHGFYDFVVMTIPILTLLSHFEEMRDFIIESSERGPDFATNDPNNFELLSVIHDANLYTMVCGVIIVFLGFCYFLVHSSLQKERLKGLDRDAALCNSHLA